MTEAMWREALRLAANQVLETMFFLGPLAEIPADAEDGAPALAVRLAFEGQPSGELTLELTSRAARTMAADFLGEEPEALTARQTEDVLREMANMICGAVLSRVESAAVFHLNEPRMIEAQEDAGVDSGRMVLAFELPDGRLTLRLRAERLECPETVVSVS